MARSLTEAGRRGQAEGQGTLPRALNRSRSTSSFDIGNLLGTQGKFRQLCESCQRTDAGDHPPPGIKLFYLSEPLQAVEDHLAEIPQANTKLRNLIKCPSLFPQSLAFFRFEPAREQV